MIFPNKTTDLVKIKKLGGTTGATLYQDDNDNHYVLKRGGDENHIKEEVLAENLYRAAGLHIPFSATIEHYNPVDGSRRLLKISEFVTGTNLLETDNLAQNIKQLQKFISIDLLLGNRDLFSGQLEDILVTDNGNVLRLDHGACLRTSAQGTRMPFTEQIIELDSIVKEYDSLGFPVTREQFSASIAYLEKNRQNIIDYCPEETLKNILGKRINNIMKIQY